MRRDPLAHLRSLPYLGVGLGYRKELDASIRANRSSIDCLEIISEHYFDATPDRIARLTSLAEEFPLVPHGIEMSIGTVGEVDPAYLSSLAHVTSIARGAWASDHLSFTRAGGIALGQLTPLVRDRAMAIDIARKAQAVQDRLGVPFLLENVSYYVNFTSELTEAEFIAEIMSRCTCGMLLDLTNLFLNSRNHGYDPLEFLETIPLDRVVQIHLAGGDSKEHQMGDVLLDLHGAAVYEESFKLLDYVAPRAANLRSVIIERDQNFPEDFGEILADLDRARQIVSQVRRAA
ncbi:DUF692 domain-containing protein [Sorangium sp. So ce1099]|uniref:DUF692 domain-containing protein n=1 Tax=Sorangium sp. So ce1099 TaxID=3133331 RepID=UPI003F6207DD